MKVFILFLNKYIPSGMHDEICTSSDIIAVCADRDKVAEMMADAWSAKLKQEGLPADLDPAQADFSFTVEEHAVI